jgi:hypothetical protein
MIELRNDATDSLPESAKGKALGASRYLEEQQSPANATGRKQRLDCQHLGWGLDNSNAITLYASHDPIASL